MAKNIINYATLDYFSGSVAGTAISNVAQTTVRETFGITKDAYRNSYRPGDVVTYVIQIISRENAPASFSVYDDLGTYTVNGIAYTPLEYISYLLYVGQTLNPQTGGVNVTVQPTGHGVRFTFDNLPAVFSGMTLIVQARVNEYAPIGQVEAGRIVNTSELIVNETAVASASAAIEVEDYAELKIVKSMTPDPVTDGGVLTYQFVICNYGTIAPTEVTLRDRFQPAPAIPLSVTVDGVSVDRFDYNYQTGMFVLGSAAQESFALTLPAATFTRDAVTGVVSIQPGMTTVTVSGVIRL